MPDQFVEAFVDKLVLLEQKMGNKVHYRMMPPLTTPIHDSFAIQTVAKQIAEFIELRGFTFIIAITKQKEKVAGRIDLSTSGRDVFVEVDPDIMKFPDAVAATLCHEICHKWLQVNGVRSPLEIDNEILTDITCVFLGLGKIMLNGCRTTHVKHELVTNGTRTITNTMATGYLDRDQLAFVYCLVCEMRKIPSSTYRQGLNAEAKVAVRRSDSSYGHHYDRHFHRMETTQEIVTSLNNQVLEVQRTLADLNNHVTYIKKCLCDTTNDFLIGGHGRLDLFQKKAVKLTQDNDPDPALRFLRAIQSDFEVRRLIEEVRLVSEDAEELLRHANVVGLHLNQNNHCFPVPSPKMFNIVTCPKDGTKLRLPENSNDVIATCPTCKYRFAYNTNTVSFSEQPVSPKATWWKKIRNLMD